MPNFLLMSTIGGRKLLDLKRVAVNGAGYFLGVFTGSPVFSVPPVTADITECTFAGYARQAVTNFGAAAMNASPPDADSSDVTHTFSCTGGGSTDTYGGSVLYDAAVAGNLLLVTKGNTGAAIAFDASGKFVQVTPRLTEASYQAYP